MNRRCFVAIGILCLALAACSGGKKHESENVIATPRAIPSPVATPPDTAAGFALGDAALDPLPGAKVDYGRLGGMNYQIEIPANWNGRLVMYMHGNDIDTTLQVYPPRDRADLIRKGFAWASSSYTINVTYVSGIAADETAALWDFFVNKYGMPVRTYAMGDSMGGAAAFTSAERYANRYDGALALCPDAPPFDVNGDFFVIAAYAAGVTQQQYDSSDLGQLVDTKIKPALRDPTTRDRFESILLDRQGGADRPLAREGLRHYMDQLWVYAFGALVPPSYGNAGKQYHFSKAAGVSDDDFNANVIRIKGDPARDTFADVNRITGDLGAPTITVQPTGDVETVFSENQELRRRVEAAGKSDLLVQRTVQSSRHCFDGGLGDLEVRQSLDDLVAWVDGGKKPDGEDLLGDLHDAGEKYTLLPRLGLPAADAVPGAGARLTLHGTITLDGKPLTDLSADSRFEWIEVGREGVSRSCSYAFVDADAGAYSIEIASDAEETGCGTPGAEMRLWLFDDGTYYASDPVPWPDGRDAAVDFALAAPALDLEALDTDARVTATNFSGLAYDASGEPLPPGTLVEAYIDGALCGRTSIPRVVMVFDQPGYYTLSIASPAAIPSCKVGGTVTFKLDGRDATETATNDHDRNGHVVDLHLP